MDNPDLYPFYGIGGALLLMALWLVASYNRFVNQKNLIENSWSNVDTELRRRYDLIPNLVETVQGYAAHERAVFEEVTEARARALSTEGTPEVQAAAEGPLVTGLRHLFAVAEGYPDLRASTHFLHLQRELANTEDRIQAARRFFNANVADYNRRVESVPSNLVAKLWNFDEAEFFQIEAAVRSVPEASFG